MAPPPAEATAASARAASVEELPHPVVDNHCHLDMRRGDDPIPDVAAVLVAAAEVGVDRVVHIGCDLPGARAAVALAEAHPALVAGVAIHPNEAPRLAAAGRLDEALAEIEVLSRHPRVRVVGETGMDRYRTGPEGAAVQEESFRSHIAYAKATGKALQIHDRDAHDDVLRILADAGAPERTVMHCFSGDAAMARECVARGYHLSFAGPITYKNADGLRAALAVVPLDRLLVETDAPYLTPAPHRGRSNAPAMIPHTVAVMAQVLDVDLERLCRALSDNAERLYGPW